MREADQAGATPFEWHILTGDCPPTPGGVADYTALLAQALTAEGQQVHVYCRGDAVDPEHEASGVQVHRVAGQFDRAGLARLDQTLDRYRGPRMILVQYVPHSFGCRAMNLPFVAWVARRARCGDEVRVMFHEVAYPWVWRPLRHNLIAATNRVMAAIMLRACTRAYVAIPAWLLLLRRLGSTRVPIAWTPVPSNIPDTPEQLNPGFERVRCDASEGDPTGPVVGHFGTYGPLIVRLLKPIVCELLDRRADVRLRLLGAGGDRWRQELIAHRAEWSGRIDAPGAQTVASIRDGLRSCDCLVQPYPDGVSSRRGTIMAALANGIPVITNIGKLSEPIWSGGAVALISFRDANRAVTSVSELLDSPSRRQELACAGRQLYEDRFAIAHTVRVLLQPNPEGPTDLS